MIRNNDFLRELSSRRHREEVENRLMDDKPLADLIEKIIKKSPTLTSLFIMVYVFQVLGNLLLQENLQS